MCSKLHYCCIYSYNIVQIKIFLHYHYGVVERTSQHLIEKWARENQVLKFHCGWKKNRTKINKKLSLKCKACINFEGEINCMSKLKKACIGGYNEGRLVSIKGHCNGKPHMKTLCTFKASVLKIPAEVGKKGVDTNVSLDDFKQLKRKAYIAYFFAKNDISFKTFPNLVDLVMRKVTLNWILDLCMSITMVVGNL